jgi:hypothetical protein
LSWDRGLSCAAKTTRKHHINCETVKGESP